MASDRKTIRVNLRFGPRTEAALWREIDGRRPYARAKFVRGLIRQGWRMRFDETRAGSPRLVEEWPKDARPVAVDPPAAAAPLAHPPRAADEFGDGVLGLLGRTVRL